ncbi:MAG: hypothetical protein WC895_02565 [Candidatus Shapirobacteria bacterium]|jgi:hypothetical protein
MSDKRVQIASKLLAKGETELAKEVLALDWSAEDEYKRLQGLQKEFDKLPKKDRTWRRAPSKPHVPGPGEAEEEYKRIQQMERDTFGKVANPLYTEVVELLDKASIGTKEASRALYDVLKTSWALAPGTEQEDKEPIMELAVALQKHAKQIDEIGAAIRPLADPPYSSPSKEWDRSRRPS